MKVLVAGGTGFIGSHLCVTLRDRGHDVTALSRDPDTTSVPDGVDTAVGDVSAYDSIEEIVGSHDAVVNLVALSPLFKPSGGASHEDVHLRGTENLLEAAQAGETTRFLQMSALGADPDGPTEYIRTKGRAENAVMASALEWTIVCPSVVFGDGDEFIGFTKQLTTPYLTGLPGGGKTRFQPIWVGDLVPILADCLEDERHVGERYEIGGPEVLTLKDVTELAYRAEGRSVTVLPVPMFMAKIGLTVAGPVPFVPFGPDQARSLTMDNSVTENDVAVFGYDERELKTIGSYLGLESTSPAETAQPA